jgi:hypothetical protein
MNRRANQLVVDVGGGKTCPFAKYRDPQLATRIVAVDISDNRCYYTAPDRLPSKHGFDVEDHRVSYYQSRYYNFFLPLYCAGECYESIARAIGMPNLGAYSSIVARRRRCD